MSTPNSRRLLTRLHRDLAELHDTPYPGVDVFTDDSNMRHLCLVLTPPGGPWKDLSLHFQVEIPDEWPGVPPKFQASSQIDHPNLFTNYICCDLLKTQDQIYAEVGYTGGYTPALTLRGLFLQFLTFFSSNKVEQDGGYVLDIGEYLLVEYIRDIDMEFFFGCLNAGTPYYLDDSARLAEEYHRNPGKELSLIRNYKYTYEHLRSHKTKNSLISTNRIHRLELINPRWSAAHKSIIRYTCPHCAYGSPALPHVAGRSTRPAAPLLLPYLNPPQTSILDDLPDDIFYVLAPFLPSESVLSFSEAFPRFRAVVESSHELLQRELQCFFLKTPLSSCILGVGVSVEPRSRRIASDFDWLSEDAFTQFKVRRGIEKRQFGYFLPLAFSRRHFEVAEKKIWECLGRILQAKVETDTKPTRGRRGHGQNYKHKQVIDKPLSQMVLAVPSVTVIYRMMNGIVVSLMESCDGVVNKKRPNTALLVASEKAVYSYCHLFHLLICLSRRNPAVLQDATKTVKAFIRNVECRVKAQVPDLGEFIVMVTLVLAHKVEGMRWEQLNGLFLEEVIIRNVRWVLKERPDLEILEDSLSNYRLTATFHQSKTSFRLIMFQIAFLQMFVDTYSVNLGKLDDNYGFAENEVPERMVKEIKDIYLVKDWPTFFERARYEQGRRFGALKFWALLKEAVKTSARRGYHTSSADTSSYRELKMKNEKQYAANGKV